MEIAYQDWDQWNYISYSDGQTDRLDGGNSDVDQ